MPTLLNSGSKKYQKFSNDTFVIPMQTKLIKYDFAFTQQSYK